ncbi:HAD-IIA family hydrolase [Alkalispirochaeta americana]|nr:HAD-IIA family hydrolase [Alkalispirochaeta americana]
MKKEDALKGVRMFVLDMDGTVYLGNQVIEGAVDFIRDLEASDEKDYIFFTNNSSKVPSFYAEKLRLLGLEVDKSKILTSGDVCLSYIIKNYSGKKIYLNGTALLRDNWLEKGIKLVDSDPDVVVQSFDTEMTYEKIDKICSYVRNGIPFLATHVDTNCPTENGFMPDCGAICSLITESTGIEPKYLGKPSKEVMDCILDTTGYKREEISFVGDRLYTDVACGVNNGSRGFLVLTGESTMKTVGLSDTNPSCIYDSLDEMRKYLY